MDANLEPRWNDDELELLKDHLRRLEAGGRNSYIKLKFQNVVEEQL